MSEPRPQAPGMRAPGGLWSIQRRIAQIGVARAPGRNIAKKVHLTNAIAALIGSTAIPFLVVYAVRAQWWPLFGLNLVFLLSYGLVLLLNHLGFNHASRWYLIVSSDLLILAACFTVGREVQVHLAYFVLALLPLVLFELEDRRAIISSMAVAVLCYVAVEVLPPFEGAVAGEQLLFGRAGEGLVILLTLSFIVYSFRAANERYEKELESVLEQLRAQQQALVHGSRMSALGEMAGGIAHEINNPLAAIRLRAQYLQTLLGREQLTVSNARPALESIDRTVARITRIVEALRTFARESEGDPLRVEAVAVLLEDALELCQERFRMQGATIETGAVPSGLAVECRPGQVVQILLNLLNNAFDAIRDREEKRVRIGVRDAGDSVEISVVDSGPGIPAYLREKVFQPFFTTKEVGLGTGLGLSISKRLAETQHGNLELDPTSRQTRFVLTLRRGSMPAPTPSPTPE